MRISSTSVLEDAAIGDLVGILSVTGGGGPYTFTITSDPDSKFAIDGDRLEVNAPLDYETATSHSVTIEADDGVNPPISRTFTIQVIDIVDETDILLLVNGTDGLLLVDGVSFLKLASSL